MGRPKIGYFTEDGQRVPGVTTVLSCLKDYGGLINWAWKLGTEGRDYRAERDAAASAGTLAHELIDAHLCKREPDEDLVSHADDATMAKARKGCDAFREWEAQVRLEVVATEEPIVSEHLRVGGTFDAVGMVQTLEGPKLALLDFKTSNRVYPEYVAQIAAYSNLWGEAHPDDQLERWYLLRLDKDTAAFSYHSYPLEVVEAGWEAFRDALMLYRSKRRLEALAK